MMSPFDSIVGCQRLWCHSMNSFGALVADGVEFGRMSHEIGVSLVATVVYDGDFVFEDAPV